MSSKHEVSYHHFLLFFETLFILQLFIFRIFSDLDNQKIPSGEYHFMTYSGVTIILSQPNLNKNIPETAVIIDFNSQNLPFWEHLISNLGPHVC